MFRTEKVLGPFIVQNDKRTLVIHCFEIEVVLEAEKLYDNGFLLADSEFDRVREYAKERLDNQTLETMLTRQFSMTSVESLARHFFQWIDATTSWRVVAVRVSDSIERIRGEYRPTMSIVRAEASA